MSCRACIISKKVHRKTSVERSVSCNRRSPVTFFGDQKNSCAHNLKIRYQLTQRIYTHTFLRFPLLFRRDSCCNLKTCKSIGVTWSHQNKLLSKNSTRYSFCPFRIRSLTIRFAGSNPPERVVGFWGGVVSAGSPEGVDSLGNLAVKSVLSAVYLLRRSAGTN